MQYCYIYLQKKSYLYIFNYFFLFATIVIICVCMYILVGAIKPRRLAATREHPYQRAAVGVPAKPGFIEIN